MTGEVLNLRRARKERARREKRAAADANAARFGRSSAEKALDAAQTDLEARRLEGHLRTPTADDSPETGEQE